MDLGSLLPELLKGFTNFTPGNAVMIAAALILIKASPGGPLL